MSKPLAPIETRVKQSLVRNGFDGVNVVHLGDGAIKLELADTPPQSKSIVFAIVRTVTGVTSVTT